MQSTRKSDLRQLFLHCAAAYSTSNCRSCSQHSPMSSSLQHHRSIWKLLSPIPISSATALLACSRTRRSLGQQGPAPPLGLELARWPPPPPEQLASLPLSRLSASHRHADEVEQVVASAIPQDSSDTTLLWKYLEVSLFLFSKYTYKYTSIWASWA